MRNNSKIILFVRCKESIKISHKPFTIFLSSRCFHFPQAKLRISSPARIIIRLHLLYYFLDDSPESKFSVSTFRNTLFNLHRSFKPDELFLFERSMKMEQGVPKCRHMTPGNRPKE